MIDREEYKELRDIVIESRSDIKHLNERMIEYIEGQNRCYANIERRTRNLESWRDKALGAVAAVSTGGGMLGSWILARLGGS